MNFFAIPTLKNVRACLRRPSSMMPRFSLKLTLARLRTGIDSVGSLARSAAVITVSATPTSFFSTAPVCREAMRVLSLLHPGHPAPPPGGRRLGRGPFGRVSRRRPGSCLGFHGRGPCLALAPGRRRLLRERLGLYGRRAIGRLGAGPFRRLALGPLGGD